MPICPPPPAPQPDYFIQLDLTVTAIGYPPTYMVSATNQDPVTEQHMTSTFGDLDFSKSDKPVAISINLIDQSGANVQFYANSPYNVFSFAKDFDGEPKYPIKKNHFQMTNVQVSSTSAGPGTNVTFCYKNTRKDDDPHSGILHGRSRYGIFFIDSDQYVWSIDPGIGNGSN